MGDKTVLLTGGAGYIGSHVALDLLQEGYEVIILDDLSKGFAAAVTDCELVEGDTGNKNLLALLLGKRKVAAVMHFAGSTIVPESVEKPLVVLREQYCEIPQPGRGLRGNRRQTLRVFLHGRSVRYS